MSKYGCYIYLALIGGLVVNFCIGTSKLITYFTNSKPVSIEMTAYKKKKIDAEWLLLKNTKYTLIDALYKKRFGDINEIFIPLHAVGVDSKKSTIYLQTSDPEILKLVNQLKDIKDDTKALMFAAKNYKKLYHEGDISGVVADWSDIDDDTKDAIMEIDKSGSDITVIRHNATISFSDCIQGYVMSFICGVILVIMFMASASSEDEEAIEA